MRPGPRAARTGRHRTLVNGMPQVVILFALTAACFALAYVRFMRQEVRA